MKLFVFLIVLSSISLANIDMVCTDDARLVIWNLGNSDTYVMRHSPDSTVSEYLGEYGVLSLAGFSSGGVDYVAAGCTDVEFYMDPGYIIVIDPQTLEVTNSRELSVADCGYEPYEYAFQQINLGKHSPDSNSLLLVANLECVVVSGEQHVYPSHLCSSYIDIYDTGPIVLRDTLRAELTLVGGAVLAGPVSSQVLQDLSVTDVTSWGMYGYPSYLYMYSHLHQERPLRGDDMWTRSFHSCGPIWYYPVPGLDLQDLGSCCDCSMALWSDTLGVLKCTIFTDDISPQSTSDLPFQNPTFNDAMALTCNPDDPGMLLVWYQPGEDEIRCRHYQDQWNDFDHIVADSVCGVEKGNITVYSVDEGYWIAWLENGESEPDLAYVERSTVTGISAEEESPGSACMLRVSSNPFRGSVTVRLEGGSASSLQVFDMAGRCVKRLDPLASGVFIWNGCDESGNLAAAGVYLLRAEMAEESITARLIKLR